MLSTNLIGTGKLGCELAYQLEKNSLIQLLSVSNRNRLKAENFVKALGTGRAVASISELPAADLYLIAVPDDAIATVALELAQNPNLQTGAIALQFSGALDASVLSPLKAQGLYLASAHPAISIAETALGQSRLATAICTLEGDEQAITLAKSLLETIGAHCLRIAKEKKAQYHAASVFAANYLLGLASVAIDNFTAAGLTEREALALNLQLMQSSLDNLAKTGSCQQALSGPIQRGDVQSCVKHQLSLENPDHQELYQRLGRLCLAMSDHPRELHEQFTAVLNRQKNAQK